MEALSDIQKGGVSAFAGGGGGLDPRTSWEWFSHFMEGTAAGGYTFQSGSGGSAAQSAGSSSLFGSANLSCGSTATASAYGQLTLHGWYVANTGEKVAECYYRDSTGTYFDGTTNTGRLWFGWSVNVNNFQYNIGFKKTDAGNWIASCSNNYTGTTVDTGLLLNDTNFHKLTIRVNSDNTEVTFYIDDVLVATITSNIPTTGTMGVLFHVYRTSATAFQVSIEIDWAHEKFTYPTPLW